MGGGYLLRASCGKGRGGDGISSCQVQSLNSGEYKTNINAVRDALQYKSMSDFLRTHRHATQIDFSTLHWRGFNLT